MIRASLLIASWLPLSTMAASFQECLQHFPAQPPVVQAPALQRALCFDHFAVLHSGETKTPVYTVERLNAKRIQAAKDIKRSDRFYPEARLPSAHRAQLSDYKGSGYSRGHMVAAGNMWTEEGKAQSFSLANMVPQDIKHNSGAWARIEKDTRTYIERAHGDVFVFTGALFDKDAPAVGKGGVRVPQVLYKLIYDPSAGRAWAHWHQNAPDTRVTPPISYSQLRERTGIEFLPGVKLQ